MSNNDDVPVDDFFLNFGSSSNVCDQLRHSIRQEVVDIEASISTMEDESRKEDRVSQEMVRSLAHARKEMYNLRRVALDVVDSTHMNEILRARVAADLQTELVRPYLCKETDQKDDAAGGDRDSPSAPTAALFVEDRREEIKVLLATADKCKVDTVAILDRKRALHNSIILNQQRSVTENLDEKVMLAKGEAKKSAEDLEIEQRRLRITKEAIHDARTNSGTHAQDIANYTKALTAKKATHEMQRQELAALLAHEEAELLQLMESDDMERKVGEAARTVELLTKQIAEANAARERRSEIQQCLESVEEEVTMLQEQEARLEEEVTRSRDAASSAGKLLDEAKSFEEQVAAQKAHNQCLETEKILPGRKELEELKNTKEKLVMGINEVHANMETELKNLKEEVKMKCDAAGALELEIKSLSRENDQALEALAHIERARKELRESTEKQCDQNADISRKFAEACDAEEARHQELLAAKETHRKQVLQHARTTSTQRRQQLEEELEVYKRAMEMIADVESHELELARLEESRNF